MEQNVLRLANFSEELIAAGDQQYVIRFLLNQACKIVGCRQASVILFDVQKKATELREVYGFETSQIRPARIELISNISDWSYDGGEVFAIKDDRGENYLLSFDPDEKLYFDCELRIPLINRFPKIGILNIGKKSTGTDYSEEDVAMMQVIVNLARLALEKIILLKKDESSEDKNKTRGQTASFPETQIAMKKRGQDVKIIGVSPAIREIHSLIDRIASKDVSVFITGESGTGKDLVARSIHQKSNRWQKPFVAMNCAALPETLVESELFGHEKGAFTGAHTLKKGKFEYADGGTLFLDEIGDMSLATQAKLLRVLEDGSFQRTGSNKTLHADVRVIAATNKDILQEIEAGNFREDLFYRINLFQIHIPPLRERREDIPVLADYFLQKFSRFYDKPIKQIRPDSLDRLLQYEFPGNVRELQNIIERAVIMEPGGMLNVDFIPHTIRRKTTHASSAINTSLSDLEKEHIQKVLKQVNYNKSQAARILGIARKTLREKMQRYELMEKSS